MIVGIDFQSEKVYLAIVNDNTIRQIRISAKVARAIATQLIASAETLDQTMEDGLLGNDEDDKVARAKDYIDGDDDAS